VQTFENAEWQRVALMAVGDAVLAADPDGRVTFLNPAATALTGWAEDEAVGRPLTEVFRLFDEQAGRPASLEASGEPANGRAGGLLLRGRDGGDRPIEGRALPLAGGGTVLVLRDLGELRRAEEAGRESEARLRLALQAGRLGTWEWDLRTGAVALSPALEGIHGRAPGSFPGTFEAFHDDVHPDDRDSVLAALRATAERGGTYQLEYRLLPADGRLRWVEARGRLMRDPAGRPAGLAGVCLDVTRRKEDEEEIHRLNEGLEHKVEERTARLREANRELESFSYSVSHDLRAPIRHISGFAEMLQKNAAGKLDPAGERYLRIITEAARQAGMLVDELLAFSRMGRAELRQTRVDMRQMVEGVCRELEPETEGRLVRWNVAPLPEVRGDPSMLRLVWRNLLTNAVKYTRPRPKAIIDVDAAERDGEVVFRVRDNGVGFDMRYADKLFGVFQRLHAVEEFEGTGIGLANVRRLVSRHGGRTWAEGAVGQGATFYFSLPAGTKEGE
jgi:PAS domain S-box-containing protein